MTMRTLASAIAAAGVVTVLAACGGVGGGQAERPCEGPGTGGPRVVYRAEPTPEAPTVSRVAIEQTIEVMCRRARALGSDGARIRELGGDRIGVRLGPGPDAAQTAVALGIPARLALYDWDANVIGNPDRPLPDLLRAIRRATAAAPRAEAEDLPPNGAEQQTADRFDGDVGRIQRFYDERNDASGPTYYAEGGAGRIVAGPENSCAGLAMALDPRGRRPRGKGVAGDLDAAACTRRLTGRGLPTGGRVHVVPRGIRVVAAARPGGGDSGGLTGTPPERPAGYFVIEDDAGVLSDGIESAREVHDESTGVAGVRVHFNEQGAIAYRALTQSIATRGLGAVGAGNPRVAIALDDQLVSLAAIDPSASPGGLDPGAGALIGDVGGVARARLLAKLLDAGALPLDVRPAP